MYITDRASGKKTAVARCLLTGVNKRAFSKSCQLPGDALIHASNVVASGSAAAVGITTWLSS